MTELKPLTTLKRTTDILHKLVEEERWSAEDAMFFLNTIPDADVAPKSEVARLEQDVTRLVQENETLKDSNEHLAVMLEETKIELEAMRGAANSYKMHYETAKAEAVKEFAEGLKTYYRHIDKTAGALIEYTIDTKVKEFLGGVIGAADSQDNA